MEPINTFYSNSGDMTVEGEEGQELRSKDLQEDSLEEIYQKGN